MRNWMLAVVALALPVALFQNCSDVGYSSNTAAAPDKTTPLGGGPGSTGAPDDAFGEIMQGLKGGHFDLDTSSRVYAPSAGRTDHHVHEYDDKYNVTYADFFNLLDGKFGNINEIVQPDARFVLIVANAQLSPGGVLSINGQSISVTDYQAQVARFIGGDGAALPVYTLSGASDRKLSGLRIGFAPDTLTKGGLIATETSCVVKNDPGKKGEYRNGALVIQAIAVDSLKINQQTQSADLNGGLLWESTLFWHWSGGCYK